MTGLLVTSLTVPFAALFTVTAARHGLGDTLAASACVLQASLPLSIATLLGGATIHAAHDLGHQHGPLLPVRRAAQ